MPPNTLGSLHCAWRQHLGTLGAYRGFRVNRGKVELLQAAPLKCLRRLLGCAKRPQDNVVAQHQHPQSRALCQHVKGKTALLNGPYPEDPLEVQGVKIV